MLEDIGKILREERERQGKSLKDVHNATKISIHNLKALEEGDIKSLPHPVYVKGFIKNYADFLGLDGHELSQKFIEEHEVLVEKDGKEELKYLSEQRDKSPFLAIVISVLLVVLIFVVAYVALKLRNKKEMPKVIVPKENNLKGSEKKMPPVSKKKNNPVTIKTPSVKKNTIPSAQKSENPSSEVKGKDLQNQEKTKSVKNFSHSVKIFAMEPCWLRAKVDGEIKEFYLKKDESLVLKFNNKLRLKLGNAGGIELEYDGQSVPLKARSGEVRIIEFP